MTLLLSLHAVEGESGDNPVRVCHSPFLIGRAKTCDFQPENLYASRLHCQLNVRNGRVFVEDALSRHGTFVNDERIEHEQELRNGDVLRVGSGVFRVSIQVPQEFQREDHLAAAAHSHSDATT